MFNPTTSVVITTENPLNPSQSSVTEAATTTRRALKILVLHGLRRRAAQRRLCVPCGGSKYAVREGLTSGEE